MKKLQYETNVSEKHPNFGNVNWNKIEDNLNYETRSSVRNVVFISKSESHMSDCEKSINLKNLRFYSFDDLHDALRMGVHQFADIIVLIDEFFSASHDNFAKLIRKRSKRDAIEVIILTKSNTEKLTDSISESLGRINRRNSKKIIVTEICNSQLRNRQISNHPNLKRFPNSDENEFRDLLSEKLSSISSESPDKILKEAIKVIKDLD